MEKLIIKAFYKKKSTTPIWLMRQAGRYLPEYRDLRKNASNFLDFCYNPEMAMEATLQPLKRFDLDAAIIFSDILVIPDSMGLKVEFLENHGPLLETVENLEKLNDSLKKSNSENLKNIYKAINLTRNQLPQNKALIGFAGGAWTIACYMVEGKLTKDFSKIKKIYYSNKEYIIHLLDILVDRIADHLIKQIEAGADLIQIFDSWAGMVPAEDYNDLIINPNQKIVKKVKALYPEIKIICFPRMSGMNYKSFCEQVNCDAIGVDQFIPISWVCENSNKKIIQGNLDPLILLGDEELIKNRVDNIFNKMNGKNFIFNLGHGVVPNTDPEKVRFLINYVKEKNV